MNTLLEGLEEVLLPEELHLPHILINYVNWKSEFAKNAAKNS